MAFFSVVVEDRVSRVVGKIANRVMIEKFRTVARVRVSQSKPFNGNSYKPDLLQNTLRALIPSAHTSVQPAKNPVMAKVQTKSQATKLPQ